MSEKRLVDTNVIVRHLTQDHERHAKAAGALFSACDRGELTLVILPPVLAECVFVLESFYQHPRADIARVLAELVNSPGVELPDLQVYLDALRRYAATKLHFVDCVVAAASVEKGIAVATFDGEFRKFRDVKVDVG